MSLESILFISKFNSPILLSLFVIFVIVLINILTSLNYWLFPVEKNKKEERSEKSKIIGAKARVNNFKKKLEYYESKQNYSKQIEIKKQLEKAEANLKKVVDQQNK